MERNGTIRDEFGEKVGRYWYRIGQNSWSFVWHGLRFNGYTRKGIEEWASRLEYFLVDDEISA